MMMTRRQLALLVAVTLMWGCNWPMMKISLREVPRWAFVR
jgi:drug/metabolite transporter (DMT)-like permease